MKDREKTTRKNFVRTTDEFLLKAYHDAVQMKCPQEFIKMLLTELIYRGIVWNDRSSSEITDENAS